MVCPRRRGAPACGARMRCRCLRTWSLLRCRAAGSLGADGHAHACPSEDARGQGLAPGYRSSRERRSRAPISQTETVSRRRCGDPLPAFDAPPWPRSAPMSGRVATPAFHPAEAGAPRSNWRDCADGARGERPADTQAHRPRQCREVRDPRPGRACLRPTEGSDGAGHPHDRADPGGGEDRPRPSRPHHAAGSGLLDPRPPPSSRAQSTFSRPKPHCRSETCRAPSRRTPQISVPELSDTPRDEAGLRGEQALPSAAPPPHPPPGWILHRHSTGSEWSRWISVSGPASLSIRRASFRSRSDSPSQEWVVKVTSTTL